MGKSEKGEIVRCTRGQSFGENDFDGGNVGWYLSASDRVTSFEFPSWEHVFRNDTSKEADDGGGGAKMVRSLDGAGKGV